MSEVQVEGFSEFSHRHLVSDKPSSERLWKQMTDGSLRTSTVVWAHGWGDIV